jgi:hypothetical protein
MTVMMFATLPLLAGVSPIELTRPRMEFVRRGTALSLGAGSAIVTPCR